MEYHEDPKGQEHKPDVEEQYSFMQETIKDETGMGSRKKTRNLILKYAGLGLVFGVTACLSFSALKPWADRKLGSSAKHVTIPEDKEEDMNADSEPDTPAAPPVLTLDNYREMNQALCNVGNEVNKSIVEISGEQSWRNEAYDSKNSVSGVIVMDNGQELLIFAKSSVADEGGLSATFVDGESCTATLKQKDDNMGFAVFSVARTDIKDSTWSQIKVAVLGSSYGVSQGNPVIVLGSPFGYFGAMGFGVLADSGNSVVKADGEYDILCTDIAGVKHGTGVIVNIKSEVVGMIDQTISNEDSMNLLSAYGISDMKPLINLLSNGYAVPYLGIKGTSITEEISAGQGISRGIYVQEVQADSPAMTAGIQSGDIITSIGGKEVQTVAAFHNELIKLNVGSKTKIKGLRQGSGGYVDIQFNVTVGNK